MSFIYKRNILFFCIILAFVNCNHSANDETMQEREFIDTLIQTDKSNSEKVSKNESSFRLESYNNQEVVATYLSASMYAATTHYYFETEIGEEILVAEGLDEATPVKLPKNMLEKLEEEAGLPEGNPELIGNIFTLYFNDKGNVYKVIPVK